MTNMSMTKYNIIRFALICTSFFLFASNITAQEDEGAELLKPFRARLQESSKKVSIPLLPPIDNQPQKQEYNNPDYTIKVSYPSPTVRPLAYTVSENQSFHKFYLKGGIGYPLSPNAELSYHDIFNKNLKISAQLSHISLIAMDSAKNYNQGFGKTHFDFGATYFHEKGVALGTQLGFNLDAYRFYGHHQLSEILPDSIDLFPGQPRVSKDSVQQNFFEFFGNLHLFNHAQNSLKLNYRGDLDFYYLNDRYNANEFSITPKTSVEKWLGNGKNKHRLGADLFFNFTSFNNDSTGAGRVLFNFHPFAELNFGIFKAKIAANLGASENKFFIYPDVHLKLSLVDGFIEPFAGVNGQMKMNTFRSISLYLPFISSQNEFRHTGSYEFYGGLGGTARGISYELRASYFMNSQMPLFLNDSTQKYLRFNILYDDINYVHLKGTFDIEVFKNLNVKAFVAYNLYTQIKNYQRAYHLPVLESNIALQYKLKNLLIKAEFFLNSGVAYQELLTKENKNLGFLYDINLAAYYWFGKTKQNIGIYAELNNIANNVNPRWYLYPQLGLNGRIGFIMKF